MRPPLAASQEACACNSCSHPTGSYVTLGATGFMNARVRLLLLGLAFGISIAAILSVGRLAVALREEPLYQGKTLSYWVTRVGRIEEFDGTPKDAVAAIRAIGPKAVPFLLEWMPHRLVFIERFLQLFSRWFSDPNTKQGPSWDCVEIAWWA